MLKNIFLRLRYLDLMVGGAVFVILVIYTFVAVFMRYIFNRPVTWGEEFQLLCIVVIVFMGAGAAFRTGNHIAVDFLVDLLPRKLQKIIVFVIYALSVGIIVYFFIQSSVFAHQMYSFRRATPLMRFPLFIAYSVFPISCILIIINYTIVTFTKYFRPDITSNEEAEK